MSIPRSYCKNKEAGDELPPAPSYDGATPTKKSIVAWAAKDALSANAASCEGAVRLAAVPPLRSSRS